jgi:hypothetical protein
MTFQQSGHENNYNLSAALDIDSFRDWSRSQRFFIALTLYHAIRPHRNSETTITMALSLHNRRWYPIIFVVGCFAVFAAWSCLNDARPELLLSGIAAVAGLSYFLYRQHLDETKLFNELFIKFNERYDELKDDLTRICLGNAEADVSENDKNQLFRYFNLCSEEFLFYKSGYIDEQVWQSWQSGIREIFKNPRVKDLWEKEPRDSYYGFKP